MGAGSLLKLRRRRVYDARSGSAAILAAVLAGWYLIAPPAIGGDLNQLDTGAPIQRWQIIHSFGSASECEQNLTALRNFSARDTTFPSGNLRLQMSYCIAADDPRFKGN
ncbi:MAG: hypothetical protein ABSG46_00725 [Candidatus Binataceae bacterium]|jgi:hypothetical protein